MLLILALGRKRQVAFNEFEASLFYTSSKPARDTASRNKAKSGGAQLKF